ncbi:unnamed protein product [Adineta ricciae]|uniref:Uncharacterized protein n=1 Tax=Adineta ricciae TaxID=249248 RepID=A0A814BZI2_ADIRI|nr:unnamed protein product [Adineta ricciae]
MDSISNSGVSLILNPDIANVINDHQHDLSTCEEEFENQEEIQQMLVNAFDSHSLSNTENDDHVFDDDDEDGEEEPVPNENPRPDDHHLCQQENESLRQRLATYMSNEEIYRKTTSDFESKINELNEKYEQNLFSLRLEYETKIEQLTMKTSEQQIEMLTLKQMYETIYDEKCHVDQQINELRSNERNLQENLDRIQIENERLSIMNKKPSMLNNVTQTEPNNEVQQQIDELNRVNIQLTDQLKRLQIQFDEREQIHSDEKLRYEKSIADLSKQPSMISLQLQTDFPDDDRKIKQLQGELDDYKLKLNSKQMEFNSLKFDYDNLQHDMNDRLSLLTKTVPNDQLNQITLERDQYLAELMKLKNELPELKQQMIDSFQLKVVSFKEQIEDEYVHQYEQVLEKNKQVVRGLILAKQEEFKNERNEIIAEYEEKFKVVQQQQQLNNDERRTYEQKIEELTRANDKCSQYLAKHGKTSLNLQHFDEVKRKYNDEIHRLYDQIAKQNQQQIVLIDEHQKQLEQGKLTYDQRYRILLDEWKF